MPAYCRPGQVATQEEQPLAPTGRPKQPVVTRHRGAVVVLSLLALLALVVLGAGWHYSNEIHDRALEAEPPPPPEYEVTVLEVDEDVVTLEREPSEPGLLAGGVWGLRWPQGYGQVEDVLQADGEQVARPFTHLTGAPLQAGDEVDVEGAAYPSDPQTAFGLEFDVVRYRSELGPTPAWRVPAGRDTWVVFVHGLNAPKKEALRLVGPVAEAGFPALVISYRNDPGAPQTESGLRRWGQTEWRDVEAAVRYALGEGASEVVLVGYSMGGAIVTSFLYESPLAEEAVGAVLDSPALDLDAVIDLAARQRDLPLVGAVPPPVTVVAKTLTTWRYGIDWDAVDYVERAAELEVPVQVVHGTADAEVPLATSEAFAAARPDLVTLLTFPGAGHVRAWNVAPDRYEREVLAFLEQVSAPARDRSRAAA